ncbi:MAG: tetratricopeptide repeat protein [Bdellovibrionota bacterium]
MKIVIFWATLIAAISAAYWPALSGSFIWDDTDLIRNNPLVTSPGGLRLIWLSREATDFWPITNSFFWLEWKIWGESTLGYHVVNLALHLLNCVLVFRIAEKIGVPFVPAIVALFALHPMNVETVAWIFQAKTLLSTFFVLTSALVFLKSEEKSSRSLFAVSVLLFAAGLLSKISVVMWPVVLAIYVFTGTKSVSATIKKSAPFFLLAFVAGIVNLRWYPYAALSPTDAIHDLGFVERCLLVGWTTWFYVWKTLLPYPISFIYPRWTIAWNSVFSWIPTLVLLILVGVVIWRKAWRKSSAARGFAGYWIFLFPALGFFEIYFQKYSYVADHWHYQALPILIAVLVVALGRRLPAKIGIVALVAVLVAFVALDVDHAKDFRGPEEIWSHAIEDYDRAFLAHNNLGLIQFESGRVAEAELSFQRSLEANPNYREALLNLGRLKKNAGHYGEAEQLYLKAIVVSPKFFSAFLNIGALYGTIGRYDDAKEAFERALAIDPEAAVAHFNLAAVYQSQGDKESTYREIGLANKVSGLVALKYGETAKARDFLTAASQYLPDDEEVRARLAQVASQ